METRKKIILPTPDEIGHYNLNNKKYIKYEFKSKTRANYFLNYLKKFNHLYASLNNVIIEENAHDDFPFFNRYEIKLKEDQVNSIFGANFYETSFAAHKHQPFSSECPEYIVNHLIFDDDYFKEQPLSALKQLTTHLSASTLPTAAFTMTSSYWIKEPYIIHLLNMFLENPALAKKAFPADQQLKRIQIADEGSSRDTWYEITRRLLTFSPPLITLSKHSVYNKNNQEASASAPFLAQVDAEKWHPLRIQGRTILLKNEAQEILAFKILKDKEDIQELFKEYQTMQYLHANQAKLGLKSDLPTPISVLKDIPKSWLKLTSSDFRKLIGEKPSYHAYVYKLNASQKNYFTYLHDENLSFDEYKKANQIAVNDLYILFKHGIVFHQLADLFHAPKPDITRGDGTRYMVLTGILRALNGTGDLRAWKKAVSYPNLRGTGIADVGDHLPLSDLTRVDNYTTAGQFKSLWNPHQIERRYKHDSYLLEYYFHSIDNHGDKAGNYVLANTLAEYQYVLFLIAGLRAAKLDENAKDMNKPSDEIFSIWKDHATQVVENCIQAISILTLQSESKFKDFLLAMIDIDRLARQMQFWMTTDYISHLKNHSIPTDIYGSKVEVETDNFKTLNSSIGFSLDGIHVDLGARSGQEPIKEANKLFYWMTTIMLIFYHNFRLTFNDIHKIVNEPNLTKSEELRKNAFSHLNEKEQHEIQLDLCRERLRQNDLPSDVRENITAEAKKHEYQRAIAITAGFWNKSKLKKTFDDQRKQAADQTDPMDIDPPTVTFTF